MLRLSLLLFALLAAGCYDDAGVPAPKNDPLPEANLSLPDLSARSCCRKTERAWS